MAVTTGGERHPIVSTRTLTALVDFAAQSHARAVMVLLVAALLNVLPGFFSIPPTDRDEARFAQATKQMIESGDYIDIRLQDEVRYKKPVGIYWLQAAAVKAGGAVGVSEPLTTIWLYRVPSLAGAAGAVLLIYWAALAFVSRRAALLAGLMLASCLLLGVEGRIAKTDAMLLATCVAALGALGRLYLAHGRGGLDARSGFLIRAIFWTALAGDVLLKGPVIVMIAGLCAATLVIVDRSARWIMAARPIAGMVWCAILVLPWFLAITSRSGETFFTESVGHDLLSKIFSGQESHGAPPGFYLLLFWLTFWPGATLALLAAPAVWAARREPATRLLLAWLVPAWIVFELVVTKLPHYVLPLYPAIAILIAGIVDARTLSTHPWLMRGAWWWVAVPLLMGSAGIAALLGSGGGYDLLVWLTTAAAAVMGYVAWRVYRSGAGAEQSLVAAAAAAFLSTLTMFGLVIPSLASLFPSVTLANVMRGSGCAEPRAAAAGYGEASLPFLAGTSTRLTDGAGVAEFLRGGECRFGFVEAAEERTFAQQATAIGLRYSTGPRVEAINMANGRPMTISVYRSEGPP